MQLGKPADGILVQIGESDRGGLCTLARLLIIQQCFSPVLTKIALLLLLLLQVCNELNVSHQKSYVVETLNPNVMLPDGGGFLEVMRSWGWSPQAWD